mmetsp:Transcript_57303/g.166283  ORF Transcript_57303/g.166283 Transcript_57303/m.166283 type:complete len:257 (+) Transcript_57303:525-1295(+)
MGCAAASSSSKILRNMLCGIDCTARSSCGAPSKWTKVFRICSPSFGKPSTVGKAKRGEDEAGEASAPAEGSIGHLAWPSLIGDKSGAPPGSAVDDKETFEGESGGVVDNVGTNVGSRTGIERKTTGSASPAPSGAAQSSMNVFFTLTGAAMDATAMAGTPTLKTWRRRSGPQPKLSHLSSGCPSTSAFAFFLASADIGGSSKEVRNGLSRNSAITASTSQGDCAATRSHMIAMPESFPLCSAAKWSPGGAQRSKMA